MKIIVFACLLLINAVFAQPTINPSLTTSGAWAGNSTTGATFFPPVVGVSCSIGISVPSYFIAINYTAPSSGTRQVALMAEYAFKPFVQVFLYQGTFTPSQTSTDQSSCGNLVGQLSMQAGLAEQGVFTINDPRYFEQGQQYVFVVTSSNGFNAVTGRGGYFALNVIESSVVGNNAAGLTWNAPLGANPCTGSGNLQQFSSYQFQATLATGFFDLFALSTANATQYAGVQQVTYFAIFNGYKTDAQLAADSCTDRLWAGSSGSQIFWTTYQPGLTPGGQYTFVISSKFPGPWGVQFLPTRTQLAQVSTNAVYPQPNRAVGPCSANTSATGSAYIRTNLKPASNNQVYLYDTYFAAYTSVAGFPQISFAYGGANDATPVACPAGNVAVTAVAQTGSYTVVFPDTGNSPVSTPLVIPALVAGATYSVFTSTLDGGNLAVAPTTTTCNWPTCANWGLQIYYLTGTTVGQLPGGLTATTTTTTATATTTTSGAANATTGATTGGQPTTGGDTTQTTGTGATTGAATTGAAASTTSSAPSLSFFSACVLLVASIVLAFL